MFYLRGECMEKTFIFGHLKPDTDSVCAALSLEYLYNQLGMHTQARILSDTNKETEFVLNYFHVKKPDVLDNVKLQIKDLNYLRNYYNNEKDSILKGFQNMTNHGISTTLIVDENNKFKGIVGMKDIAKDQISEHFNQLLTSYDNILTTIEGEEVLRFDDEFCLDIIAGAYKSTRIIEEVKMGEKNALIIGDRHSVIEYAIQSHVKLIILTGNSKIKDEHLELAKQNKVNIIKSKYDSFKVIKIINLCNYISTIIRKTTVTCMKDTDFVTDFVDHANKTKFSYYPVIDHENTCLGILRLSDLGEKKKKKVILVDHNSYDQSIYGLEEAEIMGIVDHHNIGNVATTMPINFRNMPVGSTNTIIFLMYKENKIEIPKEIAGLMLSGILSDTLILKSPTTTDIDKRVVEALSTQLNLNYEEYGLKMFNAGTSLEGMTKEEVIYNDFKVFPVKEEKIAIGQIFTTNIKEITNQVQEYLQLLDDISLNNGYTLCTLVVTDIIHNGSYFFYNEKAKHIMNMAFEEEKQGFYKQDVVSRKKQVLPAILEIMSN